MWVVTKTLVLFWGSPFISLQAARPSKVCRDLERVCLLGLKCKFLGTQSISSAHELLPAIISHKVECFDRDLTYKTQLKQLVGKNLIYLIYLPIWKKSQLQDTVSFWWETIPKQDTSRFKTVSYYRDSTVVPKISNAWWVFGLFFKTYTRVVSNKDHYLISVFPRQQTLTVTRTQLTISNWLNTMIIIYPGKIQQT